MLCSVVNLQVTGRVAYKKAFTMIKIRVLTAALLLACVAKFCTAAEVQQDFESEFEKIHEEDFREGRSAFSWMFPKASAPSCSEGRGGICTTSSLCRKYGGTRTGSCSGGGGTCCDVTYTNCREESVCTIAVNASRVTLSNTQSGIFDLRFPRLKNSDMVMLEFLADSHLTNPISEPGFPMSNGQNQPAMLVRNVGKCMMESISFSGSPTISSPFVICGRLTGQHVYLAFGNTDSVMMHVNKMSTSNINVRATWYSRRFRPVSQNCLQYFTGTNVQIQSFGWPDQQINDLKYTICFDERQSNTLTVTDCLNDNNNNMGQGTFSITGIRNEVVTNDPEYMSPYIPLLDCYRDWIQLFGENKYCNHTLPMEGLTTTTKPFQIAVNFDNAENRAYLIPAPPAPATCDGVIPANFCFSCQDGAPLYPGMCNCIENPPAEPAPAPGAVLECRREASIRRVDRYNRGFCLRAMRS